MSLPYVQTHWDKFVECINHKKQQEPTGKPSTFLKSLEANDIPSRDQSRDDVPLSRDDVKKICREEVEGDVLFGYICAMAWGGQHMRHFKATWKKREPLAVILRKLRDENLTRGEAYGLFLGNMADKVNKIHGLGPAYWTKLLYFFRPADAGLPYTPESKNCYIMDQWTAKSVNLLTGLHLVKMDGPYVTPDNKCGNYQAFCEEIDRMAKILSEERGENVTGEKVEEWLFSQGRKIGQWRKYVEAHYPYDPEPLCKKYRHISDF